MVYFDLVRDNQWWYSKHPQSHGLDDVSRIVLVVGGRRCPMTHSQRGRDGRVTRSFRFDHDSDRHAWEALRGQTVTLELEVEASPSSSEEQSAAEDIISARREAAPESERQEERSNYRPLPTIPDVSRVRPSRLFGAYLFCDWSASATPKNGPDSIWTADGWYDADGHFKWGVLENPPTRALAEAVIRERIRLHRQAGRRTLVGLDFPFGYPASSLAPILGHNFATWRDLWRMLEGVVEDGPDNSNNRFQVASVINKRLNADWYWGCPEAIGTSDGRLSTTKGERGGVAEFRIIEKSLRTAGRRPFSVWQLYGNGAVGSQSVVGLPVCERLRTDETLGLRVWPFETGFAAPARHETTNILVEIWPGVIDVDNSLHEVKDAAQVRSMVKWAAEHDSAGTLETRLEVPAITGEARRVAEGVEGWILGWMG